MKKLNKQQQELSNMLLKEHSQRQAQFIADYIAQNKSIFADFLQLFELGEPLIKQRAAWSLSKCYDAHPTLFTPYFDKLAEILYTPGNHDAIDRNITRIFSCEKPTGKPWEELLIDKCFKILEDKDSFVAAKCNAMSVIYHFTQSFPELLVALKYILNENYSHETAAYKSRAGKLLKKLKNI